MSRFLFIFFFVTGGFLLSANNTDSLLSLLQNAHQDTVRVRLLNELFSANIRDIDKALQYTKEALKLAEKTGYKPGLASSLNNTGLALFIKGDANKALEYHVRAAVIFEETGQKEKQSVALANIGNIFQSQGNYNKSIEYFRKSCSLSKQAGNRQREASLLGNIGVALYYQGNYSLSLNYYLQSLKIREEINDKKGIAYVLSNIGILYDEQKNYKESLKNYLHSLDIRKEINDRKGIANSLCNIGLAYDRLRDTAKALAHYNEALILAKDIDAKDIVASVLNNLGEIYHSTGKYAMARNYYLQTKKIYEELNDMKGICTALNNIGRIFKEKKQYKEACSYFELSLQIAVKSELMDKMKSNYLELAETFAGMGDFNKAYLYRVKYSQISDSLLSEESISQMANLKIQYETEKKEKEIQLLTARSEVQTLNLRKSRYLIISIIIGSLLIVIMMLVLFYLNKQKEKNKKLLLKQEADKALRENEKKSMARVIEAEENERTRFARDLHDGLGPLLSSIKLYVNELPVTNEATSDEMLRYTNELIDDAISSARKIANNLMPNVINDYGLIEAVRQFCNRLDNTKAIHVEVKANTTTRFHKTIEIVFYRIILELINNSLKHASAHKIEIIFEEKDGMVSVYYHDDGIGFDFKKTLNSNEKGLGLNSMINRVNTINGKIEFNSKKGEGMNAFLSVNYLKFSEFSN